MSNIAYSCLVIGLDNAGKTSLIYNIKTNVILLLNPYFCKQKNKDFLLINRNLSNIWV